MENATALPPRCKHLRPEQAEAIQRLAYGLDLPDDVRAEVNNAIYRLTEEPSEGWLFVKISPQQFLLVTKAIQQCRNVSTTLRVWNTALAYMRFDTGEIMATRDRIAEDAGTNSDEVSRAMTDLERIGAILRKRRGKRVVYFVNPNIGWNGGEGSRIAAAKEAPRLRLAVDNTSE